MDDGRWTLGPGSRLPSLDAAQSFLHGCQSLLAPPNPLFQLGVRDTDHRAQLPLHSFHADEDPLLALSEGLVPLNKGLLPINKSLVPLRDELHPASEVLRHNVEVATRLRLLRWQFFFGRRLVESPVDLLEFPAEELHQLLILTVGHNGGRCCLR